MFAGFMGWAGGAWNWFCRSPIAQISTAIVGLIFAWSVTVKALKAEGAREEKILHKAASDRERAEMAETRTEVLNEIDQRVDGADRAVERLPYLRSTDELRNANPELAAVILRRPEENVR